MITGENRPQHWFRGRSRCGCLHPTLRISHSARKRKSRANQLLPPQISWRPGQRRACSPFLHGSCCV